MDVTVNTERRNVIVAFILGVLVGTLLFWMWGATTDALNKRAERDNQEQRTDMPATGGDTATSQGDTGSGTTSGEVINATVPQVRSDSITVEDQAAGGTVVVEKAVFEEDGWVVIHEGTASRVGNALGAARFEAGEHSGVVPLLRSTEPGRVYWAVLYRDNGDKEFNLDTDFPFLQNGNQPVLTTFQAL